MSLRYHPQRALPVRCTYSYKQCLSLASESCAQIYNLIGTTLCRFVRLVTQVVLPHRLIVWGKESGWWLTRRASADLSIFPAAGCHPVRSPVSLPLQGATLILVTLLQINHEGPCAIFPKLSQVDTPPPYVFL